MAPKKGQGCSKVKKPAPKLPSPKAPKWRVDVEASSSDDDSLADQNAILEQLAAMERECGISPGGPMPIPRVRHRTRQGDQRHFQAEVLNRLSLLYAHKQAANVQGLEDRDSTVPVINSPDC